MGAYSVGEAKQDLERLLDEAISGEVVTITREGRPAVNLTPAPKEEPKLPIDDEFIEWMRLRAQARPSIGPDSVSLVREMREEER